MTEAARAAASGPAPEVATRALLHVEGLEAWYGESHILHGVDFEIRPGELVTLLGRNGAGKTTTLRSLMGMVPRREGSVVLDGHETIRLPPHRIARLRHGALPGGARHLRQPERGGEPPPAAQLRPGGMTLEAVLELFPNLKERLGSQGTKLSGGEQQMLAIGRILRTGARLLLLDEPTEGLAPVIVQQIGRHHPSAEDGGVHHPPGGAESEVRLFHRGPSLRDGPRARGGPDSRRPFPVEPAPAANVSRCVASPSPLQSEEERPSCESLHGFSLSPASCLWPPWPRTRW